MDNLKYLYLGLCLFFSLVSTAQVSNVEYGKNRVQHHDDLSNWLYYESNHFKTYWYGKSRNYGIATVKMAEKDHKHIQDVIEVQTNKKISIIVFSDITDLHQSNVGTNEVFETNVGETKLVDNKIFVYFDGNHENLREQIREGVAAYYYQYFIRGANIQENVQNAVLLNLPKWFGNGLVKYLSSPWDVAADYELKKVFQSPKNTSFDKIKNNHTSLIGRAFWYYVGMNYGNATVSNILYMSKVNRSVETGVLYVVGQPLSKLKNDIFNYYKNIYSSDQNLLIDSLTKIQVKNKFKAPITQLSTSPDGNNLLYVLNEIGRQSIFLKKINEDKVFKIFKTGLRNPFQQTDYNYPLIDWKPNGQEFSIIYEKKDLIYMRTYFLNDLENPIEQLLDPTIRRVFSMDFVDATDLILSADKNGSADLLLYHSQNRTSESLTNDFWDDRDAKMAEYFGHRGVLFSSNRINNIINNEKIDSVFTQPEYDVFFMYLDSTTNELVRLTETPLVDERYPMVHDSTRLSFLSNENGYWNRKIGHLNQYVDHYLRHMVLKDGTKLTVHGDSSLSKFDTTLIVSSQYEPIQKIRSISYVNSFFKNGARLQVKDEKGRYYYVVEGEKGDEVFVQDSINTTQFVKSNPSTFWSMYLNFPDFFKLNSTENNKNSMIDSTSETPIFETEFDEPVGNQSQKTTPNVETKEGLVDIYVPKITPYRIDFRSAPLSVQFDNSLLFNGLNTFSGGRNQTGYEYPVGGILFKLETDDILEDYGLDIGLRLQTDLQGAEYYVQFKDLKKQLDKYYSVYQKISTRSIGAIPFTSVTRKTKNIITMGVAEFRYPLDIFRSLRAIGTLRNDRIIALSTDNFVGQGTPPFEVPDINEQRIGLRLEYVFDNSFEKYINIRQGSRYKVFAEFVKKIQIDFNDGTTADFGGGLMTVLGFDARHYQRIDKKSILALRLAGATSMGAEKIMYHLGGVDGWIGARSSDVAQPQGAFAYHALAAQMRGFDNNVRNGNTYLVSNVELRIPFMRYLINRDIKSKFIQNLQLVGFYDIGLAYAGKSPFSPENPINSDFITNTAVSVDVTYFKDPLVMGVGAGLRTSLLGYFIKFDYAWGIETRTLKDPLLYLSIGTDF